MSNDHMVELPKAVWVIKIVQSIIALLVLAFSAFTISVIPNGYSGFCIFTVSLAKLNLNNRPRLTPKSVNLFRHNIDLLLRLYPQQHQPVQLGRNPRPRMFQCALVAHCVGSPCNRARSCSIY